VLYVGKAKSIRKRIVSYAREAGHTARIMRMIAATSAIEFVSTTTETEALLLEANLIKRLRPRFNVLLRDDKSFPYILITAGETPPMIMKHRGARSRPANTMARSLPRRPFIAPSPRWSARSSSAHAPIRSTRAARGRVCCTRSSAAQGRAPAKSRTRITPIWCARRSRSCPARAAP
jgi:hypothetical protein